MAKAVFGAEAPQADEWAVELGGQLEEGAVEALVASMREARPGGEKGREELRKAINYFLENARRMRYAEFRRQGLFVGSGVVEAGCKTVVGKRLKQSGMRWTVKGANAILALRCWQMSDRWEDFWEARATG